MRSALVVLALGGFAGLAHGAPAPWNSSFALPLLAGGERPDLIFAQRAIEREWGPSDDSVYVEVDVPEWRSEGLAATASLLIPGLGQAYAGVPKRGLVFAAIEVAGWVTRQLHVGRADDLETAAVDYAGPPDRSESAWSFDRWAAATRQDPADLEALHQADPEVFYDLIATDPRFLAGWSGDPEQTRGEFAGLLHESEERLQVAHYSSVLLWANHIVAAVDALRAARLANLRLAPGIGIQLKGGWRGGGPALTAKIERSF